jgi:arylsulfatase A-like enzyme
MITLTRRQLFASALAALPLKAATKPNIILTMTDDQGWGDVSYNGNPVLKTPQLDAMSASGIRFDRFYAAYPVCSPTRASVMTGRHPMRYGCFSWGYDLPLKEVTIAESLKPAGYATGHFGKWHLGGILFADGKTNRGSMPENGVQPGETMRNPSAQGFDRWFSHGNWFDLNPDKMFDNGKPAGQLVGDTSDIVMGKALEWIREQAAKKQPFFAVIWFPSPHGPHKALDKDKAAYLDKPGNPDFYGEMTGVDRNMGLLRAELRKMGIHRDTMLWFNSDNGAIPQGSAGPLSGGKGNLLEGGIRVPGILEWPGRIAQPFVTKVPVGTVDIFPTVMEVCGVKPKPTGPLDGISLVPLIEGKMKRREKPLVFEFRNASGKVTMSAVIDNEFKLYRGQRYDKNKIIKTSPVLEQLFDVDRDVAEEHDLAGAKPEVLARLKKVYAEWNQSVEKDLANYPAGV